jgi:predicted DNA repair protein MutK
VPTDFILSAEIMVISLNEVAITALVYGVVALIVKMDDVGLKLAARGSGPVSALGRGLGRGLVAPPYAFVHHLEVLVHDATGPLGGLLGWLTNTVGSALAGEVVGAVIVAVVQLLPKRAAGAVHP